MSLVALQVWRRDLRLPGPVSIELGLALGPLDGIIVSNVDGVISVGLILMRVRARLDLKCVRRMVG